jgi:hypothetical protein
LEVVMTTPEVAMTSLEVAMTSPEVAMTSPEFSKSGAHRKISDAVGSHPEQEVIARR